ncbi:hypothetical protein GYH30_040272 [Glycine max]|nr:hypothetical protein GYH30_040272 [Glycine max]
MLRTILPWQDDGRGYNIVMTTILSSDVLVGYFSWAEYDIMAPVQRKTEVALAAAFISNCGARNMRLQDLEALEKSNIKIDSYGGCHRNRDGRGKKVIKLPILDTERLWKYEGPFDSFKALVDMAVVHSSCRLCIHLAKVSREKEENSPGFNKCPCNSTRGQKIMYHIYVREKGRFEMESIYLRSSNITLEALKFAVASKFTSLNHVPIWKTERPEVLRGANDLKLYKIYPVGLTQKASTLLLQLQRDVDFRSHLESHPCTKFEAIFV